MKFVRFAAAAAVSVALAATAACTTTQRVSVQQPGDMAMSCDQIRAEFARLDTVEQDAQRDQGVNTANVAAVLLFWPAAVGNWMNADQARDLVTERRAHLMSIYNNKRCDG